MRQPTIGRLIALLTGATVVLLLTIDTTMACRFLLRHRYHSPCRPMPVCRVAPPVSCGEVIVSDSMTCGQPVDGCCGAGEVIIDSHIIDGQVIEGDVIQHTPTPSVVPNNNTAQDVDDLPDTTATPAPMPNDVDATPADDSRVEPAIVEEPADDLPADDLPADVLPDDDLPADDIFGAPTDDAAANDLFNEPATDLPAEEPADDLFNETAPAEGGLDEMPADDLDVFDQPATDAPADDLFSAPADDASGAINDTFDQPVPLEEGSDLPGFDDPLPTDEPADALPQGDGDTSDSLDDLFGGTKNSSTDEPRTADRNDAPVGDLFEGLDSPAENTAPPAANDLFEAPVETPTPDKDNSVDDLDDLFGAQPVPPKAPAQQTKPVTEQSVELPVRLWTDNTGNYQTKGRLVKVTSTYVRLLKDNGRFSTVPKHRLSEADLAYVNEVTQQLGVEYFDQVAQR